MPCGLKIALVVGRDAREKRSEIDDVGVGCDGERFRNLRGDEDFAVVLLRVVVVMVVLVVRVLVSV